MSVLFSKSCEYALQTVLYCARHATSKPVLLREVADSLYIPYHYLSKVMQQLVRRGIVVSTKGMGGGFSLSRRPEDIKLIEVVQAVDGDSVLTKCVLGFPQCDGESPCPVHRKWVEAREMIIKMLSDSDLKTLSEKIDLKIDLINKLADNCVKEGNHGKSVDLNACC